jgi:hypothetical protein
MWPAPAFNPAQHGFHFSNHNIQWSWFGPISGRTLCGGMVYGALDYFLYRMGVPSDKIAPPIGKPLQSYLYERQKQAHWNTLPRWGTIGAGIDPGQIRWLNYYLAAQPIPLFLYNLDSQTAHHVLAMGSSDDDVPTVQVYDPNYPDGPAALFPFDGGYWESVSGQSWTGFLVDYGYAKQVPPLLNCEDQWRWCPQCQGLFFIGYGSKGYCPAFGGDDGLSGPHVLADSTNYGLPLDTGCGEPNWRWCYRCSGLFFGGDAGSGGVCPAPGGGNHVGRGRSYNMAKDSGYGEGGWRWCRDCQAMFFAGGGSVGTCPAKNSALLSDCGHTTIYSPDYFLPKK